MSSEAPLLSGETSAQPDAVLATVAVSKTFKASGWSISRVKKPGSVTAVDHVSLSLYPGQTLAIVGESGCGKTTLSRLLLGLEKPSTGSVSFHGQPIDRMSRSERKNFRASVQAVFQDPYASLNPRMRVRDIICEPLVIHGRKPSGGYRALTARLLQKVGLDADAGGRYPHQFSGGQRQRVAIARALSLEPEAIILDEPVSALDVSVRAQTLNLLQDLQDEQGLAFVFISHDLAVVSHIATTVAVMYLGQVVESGPASEVLRRPRHPYTKALIDAVPGSESAGLLRSSVQIIGEVASADAVPGGCRFHPRCPIAQEVCSRVNPVLGVRQSRSVRCLAFPESRDSRATNSTEGPWPVDGDSEVRLERIVGQ